MKEIFLVTSESGAQVISARVFAKDVKAYAKENNLVYRRCDLKSIANDIVKNNVGVSMEQNIYNPLIWDVARALSDFNKFTPYDFYLSRLVPDKEVD